MLVTMVKGSMMLRFIIAIVEDYCIKSAGAWTLRLLFGWNHPKDNLSVATPQIITNIMDTFDLI